MQGISELAEWHKLQQTYCVIWHTIWLKHMPIASFLHIWALPLHEMKQWPVPGNKALMWEWQQQLVCHSSALWICVQDHMQISICQQKRQRGMPSILIYTSAEKSLGQCGTKQHSSKMSTIQCEQGKHRTSSHGVSVHCFHAHVRHVEAVRHAHAFPAHALIMLAVQNTEHKELEQTKMLLYSILQWITHFNGTLAGANNHCRFLS